MSVDSQDLDSLQRSLSDAAHRLRTAWITLISTSVYLALAVNNVTHRDLLFEAPLKLPLINIDLALVAFGFVAPFLVLILELHFLIGLTFVANRADAYKDLLREQAPLRSERVHINQRLIASIFAQLLVGAESFDKREWLRHLATATFCVTIVLIPLATVFLFLIAFLPYQSELLSWSQRGVWIVMAATLAYVLPRIFFIPRTSSSLRTRFSSHLLRRALSWLVLGAFAGLVVTIPHFPGEKASSESLLGIRSPFLNHIVLTDLTITNAEVADKLDTLESEQTEGTARQELLRSFRGRRLAGAVFDRSDLRRTDFSGARLVGASFVAARLDRASFGCLRSDEMVGRSWANTSREGALDESCADLSRADLSGTSMQGAWIASTVLHGVNLSGATLHGASFWSSELIGANLSGVQACGVQFGEALLIGASLHGARIEASDLQHADLTAADLFGTSFAFSQLDQSTLDGTRMWGTSFVQASLRGARLATVDIRRVRVGHASTGDFTVKSLTADPKSLIWQPDTSSTANSAGYTQYFGPRYPRRSSDYGSASFTSEYEIFNTSTPSPYLLPSPHASTQASSPTGNDDMGLDKGDLDQEMRSKALKSLKAAVKYQRTRDNIHTFAKSAEQRLDDQSLAAALEANAISSSVTSEIVASFERAQAGVLAKAFCSSREGAIYVIENLLLSMNSRISEKSSDIFLGRVMSESCQGASVYVGWIEMKRVVSTFLRGERILR
ncbi:MAG: pentapeptide repeat-containing protein [Rhodospirillaceae bacterium]|nr:pentapeptide repeat-containing protein [Rhodospirillaceae bacterium]